MRQIGHFVDGKLIAGSSGRSKDIFNPNTGEVQAQVNMATPSELDAAVASAAKAQICLLYTSPSPRDGLLSRMPSSA